MANMTIERITCPCARNCLGHGAREKAVNTVLARGMIASNDLKKELLRGDCREPGARRAINFLHRKGPKGEKLGCELITVLRKKSGRVLYINGRNKIFVTRFVSDQEIRNHARMLITAFQRKMLEIFEKETFKTHYLSSYEARKLVSYRRDSVEAALERLKDFGFIEEVIIDTPRPPPEEILPLEKILEWFKNPPLDKNTYYVSQAMAELFKKKGTEAAIDEITEIQVIYDVLGTLMKVYPPDLIEWIQDILRTGNKDLIQSAKGLAFDVFTRFRQQDRFLAIDVYTRFPVGDEIARNFCRKIHRVGNAFGLLITKSDMATARASYLCRQNGIGFATIEELGVAYSEVRNKVKKEREFPQNLSRDRSIELICILGFSSAS